MKTLIVIPSDASGKIKDMLFRGLGYFNVLSYTSNTLTLTRGITLQERGFINNIAEAEGVDILILQVTDDQAEKLDERVMFIDLTTNEKL